MAAGIEWGDPDPDTDEPVESDAGWRDGPGHAWTAWARRVPAGVRWVAGAAAAAGVLVAYVAHQPETRPQPVVAAPSASPAGQPGDLTLALISAQARLRTPLVSYVRSGWTPGACRLVPPGRPPERAIAAAIRGALPGYAVRDSSRTLDQSTALCTVDLRATDRQHSTLVVEIVAPQVDDRRPFTALSVDIRSDGTTTVSAATAVTASGWTVTVGTSGPDADQPSSQALLALAQNATMLW